MRPATATRIARHLAARPTTLTRSSALGVSPAATTSGNGRLLHRQLALAPTTRAALGRPTTTTLRSDGGSLSRPTAAFRRSLTLAGSARAPALASTDRGAVVALQPTTATRVGLQRGFASAPTPTFRSGSLSRHSTTTLDGAALGHPALRCGATRALLSTDFTTSHGCFPCCFLGRFHTASGLLLRLGFPLGRSPGIGVARGRTFPDPLLRARYVVPAHHAAHARIARVRFALRGAHAPSEGGFLRRGQTRARGSGTAIGAEATHRAAGRSVGAATVDGGNVGH